MTSPPVVELDAVSFAYAERQVLNAVDLQLNAGERIAITGPIGSGKTTLLHLIVGLLRASAGRVIVCGRECRDEADFRAIRPRIGLVFQQADDQLFCPSVLEDVAFGPLNLGQPPAQARVTALGALADLGIEGYAERATHRLSAGEKRMVALASVLAMHPHALLLDEPTSGLDPASEQRLVAHLERLDQAMLIVTHDSRLATRLAERRLHCATGRLVTVDNQVAVDNQKDIAVGRD